MIELSCTAKSFEALVTRVNKAKRGTATVSVNVKDLEALIIDHGRLLRAVPHKEPV